MKHWIVLLSLFFAAPSFAQQGNQVIPPGMVNFVGGASALYLMSEGSGTTFADSSGNGNTCTFNVTHPPTWTASGLNFSGNQFATCPAAAFNGAQTIMIWYNSQTAVPGTLTANQHYSIFSVDADNARLDFDTASSGWGTGPAFYNGSNSKFLESCDKAIGPSSISVTLGTNPVDYTNGHPANCSAFAVSSAYSSITATTTAYIGQFKTNSGENFKGQIYAIAAWRTVLTAAQIAQNETAMETILRARGVYIQDRTDYGAPLWVADGNSITEGGGVTLYFQNTIPYYASQNLAKSLQTYNVAIGGQTLTNLNTQYPLKTHQLLLEYSNALKVVSIEALTNDINGGVTNVTTLTNLVNTYCSAVATDGGKCIWSSVLPRSTFTGGEVTAQLGVNAAIIAEWLAGTNNIAYVIDNASSPIMGTGASITGNATYYADGTHPTAAGNQILGALQSLGICSVAFPGTSCWVKITTPATIAVNASATTQTVNLLQLGPKQKVCGVTQRVTTTFTASGLASLTSSIGNSNGSATTYSSTFSMTGAAGTFQDNGLPASPPTDSGIVQASFTASGANLSTLSAGSLDVDICVVTQP